MRDPAGQLADRLHLLRLRQRGARLLQFLLGPSFLGHVAGDLGEADQLAVLVEEAIDDDAGPETRSVLAHPPGFIFVTPFARRRLERLRRPPGRAVLRRVEHADMPADDLVGAVALDPL